MFAKRKLIGYLDKKSLELADMIDLSEGEEAVKLESELDHVLKMRAELSKPRVSKEVWVEVLKILGIATALGLVMWYDSSERTLPNNITRWISPPKL